MKTPISKLKKLSKKDLIEFIKHLENEAVDLKKLVLQQKAHTRQAKRMFYICSFALTMINTQSSQKELQEYAEMKKKEAYNLEKIFFTAIKEWGQMDKIINKKLKDCDLFDLKHLTPVWSFELNFSPENVV